MTMKLPIICILGQSCAQKRCRMAKENALRTRFIFLRPLVARLRAARLRGDEVSRREDLCKTALHKSLCRHKLLAALVRDKS